MSSASHRPSPSLSAAREPGGTGPARRTVVTAAGAAGLAAALTACGSGDNNASDTVNSGSGASGSSGSTGTTGSGGSGGATASNGASQNGGGAALAKTSDIPEGGGKIFKDQGVVVTQPTAGQFKAFSAKCTHQGCAVGSVSGGVIVCPCHNSHFSVVDGSVKQGPATQPLAAEKITVSGEDIALA
ncbi:Rieske (2Fe-2S) protein [Streptomyces broussonetiae]|uniref:Cytochrome bc1 complex Rieske iron-sulfur subunit n=1 Tax=Streptomyces broussonetiae TaxID=2686304 RepID=A0A6I6MYY2_9ACTN|nr:Rieske (2Fe-2S) protein [Streptomyces broussonetiae]QHA03431.1 Rieske 2Fe-2S domain-containing protein [Streptomyces broussonetiae]